MVRKLTPLECWRLMSFSDEDYYKAKNEGISNSQLYKQAGNSIVVKVLEGIFESLFLYKDKAENEIKTTTVKLENKVEKYDQIKWVI
jgi:site-specific DNA-cytosine methylase